MKKKIIVIKNNLIISILLIAIVFFIYSLIYKYGNKEEVIEVNAVNVETFAENKVENFKEYVPTKILPNDIDGFEIIGRLEIPKINLSTYILAHTDESTLKTSVTKLCGPNINEVGNFCIIGHNYNKQSMFGNLKKLEINDNAILTNVYGQKVEYKVYEIFKIQPDEVECLNQNTYGNRELTLITCTTGAIKRLIIKLTEVYD